MLDGSVVQWFGVGCCFRCWVVFSFFFHFLKFFGQNLIT